jgi:hypothetical protein
MAAYLNGTLNETPDTVKDKKDQLKWFSCIPCDIVQWQAFGLRSNCFVCGKWGKRGQWRK